MGENKYARNKKKGFVSLSFLAISIPKLKQDFTSGFGFSTVVKSPLEQTLSYVQYGEIDYFKMNLDDCLYPRIDEIIIPPAGVSASGKTVKATIKGRNFLSPIEKCYMRVSHIAHKL